MIYLQLLWVYLKIGTFGFGGGYAMLSLIQHEIVDLHHWLTPQQFTDVVAISQMTPGPIGINSATYVGYAVTHSVWGAVLATVAVCLPSFILVLLISYFFAKCKDNKYIKATYKQQQTCNKWQVTNYGISKATKKMESKPFQKRM